MGSTVTAALVDGDRVVLGHVGDSRAYLLRDGVLQQLSHDHSLVAELERAGRLTREEAAVHPQRSVITRALGAGPELEVDTSVVQVRDGDVLLLCSDGLSGLVGDQAIANLLGGRPARRRRAAPRAGRERRGRRRQRDRGRVPHRRRAGRAGGCRSCSDTFASRTATSRTR